MEVHIFFPEEYSGEWSEQGQKVGNDFKNGEGPGILHASKDAKGWSIQTTSGTYRFTAKIKLRPTPRPA